MTPEISTRHDGAAWHIELTRPDCGNLVTMEMIAALRDAFSAVPAAAKVVVLRGRGADFCKGRDYQSAPESTRGARAPRWTAARRSAWGSPAPFFRMTSSTTRW
jgi:enoyl-CoA hydratase/carnithine racemase